MLGVYDLKKTVFIQVCKFQGFEFFSGCGLVRFKV